MGLKSRKYIDAKPLEKLETEWHGNRLFPHYLVIIVQPFVLSS